MKFVYNDGGRAAAGFRGQADDCVVRAVAIATGRPYRDVYDELTAFMKRERPRSGKKSSPRTGVPKQVTRRYLELIGWQWVATMGIGTGCKVHLADGELPLGRLIVSVSRHLTAVIDSVIHDTHDPQRDTLVWETGASDGPPSRVARRCVYGYWIARIRS